MRGDNDASSRNNRRRPLSQEELDYIVERIVAIAGERISEVAAEKTVDRLYVALGKGVLRRFSYLIGAAVLAILAVTAQQISQLKP